MLEKREMYTFVSEYFLGHFGGVTDLWTNLALGAFAPWPHQLGCWPLSPILIGRMFVNKPSWKYSVNLVGSYLGKLFFTNLVRSIRRTATKLYSGSKMLCSTCSGNIRRTLPPIGWEQSSPVDEEEIKIKMDDSVARFFTCFGGNLFIFWLVGGAALSQGPRMR